MKEMETKKPAHQDNAKNQIKITSLNQLTNQQRIDAVVPYLISGIPKHTIIDKFSAEWNCRRETVQAIIQEALVWLTKNSVRESENIKHLNAERLDCLLGDCKNVKEKLKVLDMINRLYGLYETNVNVGNKEDEQIKFNIGV